MPVDKIAVVNPRVRNQKVFREIVSNIAAIGLKRPITVARRVELGEPRYELVCGQGRLEAFQALGQTVIPAIVIDAGNEDCMIMSLVENSCSTSASIGRIAIRHSGYEAEGLFTGGDFEKDRPLS